MRERPLIILAVVIVACILIGEVYVYNFNAETTYGTDSSMTSDSVSYEVRSGISNCFDVVITDNGDFSPITEYYLYYDGTYKENLNVVDQPIGSTELDQEYYVSQLTYQLKNRGISVTQVNAQELKDKLLSDLLSSSFSKGLIVLSGALPDTVYTGNSTDLALNWISEGGTMYWVGSLIGSAYSTTSEVIQVTGDYQMMFLGVSDCLSTDVDKAYSEIDNGYKKALSLSAHSVKYGVKEGVVSSSLSVGFTQDGYSSITFVKNGYGQVCIIAGDYANDQRADLAQVIAAHLCYQSELVSHCTGTVTRNSVSGTVAVAPMNQSTVYIYLGGYYLEYGRCNLYKDMNPL